MLLAVFLGGALGGLARWGLADGLGAGAHDGAWPTGTMVANLLGALVLGIVAARLLRHPDPSPRRARAGALLGPGLCGALTTFSTLQVEAVRLIDTGHPGTALAYMAVTITGGFALVRVGLRA
ncbi:fluoride efflux transporter CrcB [Conexibacter sp. W3-3-2]|uniref:fluoride efflux transporter FluC n=1 Tax=Conexibacter sp. W3-3-2 TaxID=2675227 RepID=UPI0012B81DB8|nr:CrcB family protein [Conexibacter sp. W3-3-2]MTD45377.1 fluoride efflux transporter CrcB [Conexibacter sp. W3-3-2]